MEPLLSLTSEHLAFQLAPDASAIIFDSRSGRTWRMGPIVLQEYGDVHEGYAWQRQERSVLEQYPARFRCTRDNDLIRLTLLGRFGEERGTLACRYTLDADALIVELLEIDQNLPSLVFPPPIESHSLVLPMDQGRWITTPAGKWERYVHRYLSQLNMRWFGGLGEDNDHGWICIVEEGCPDGGILRAGISAAPLWLKELDRWSGARRLRYEFADGGYVGLAKAYRAWANEHGIVKTLKQKIAEVPVVANLIGGRNLRIMMARTVKKERFDECWLPMPDEYAGHADGIVTLCTYAQAKTIIAEAKQLGMQRGRFTLAGWIDKGYDETHPDVWPPCETLGSIAELKELCGEQDPYCTCLHDNYQDIYTQSPSWPNGVCRTKDGAPLHAGIWCGGQAYILHSQSGFEYARRNWPQLEQLGLRALYSDTVTAELFRESWEEGHTQTRTQDMQWKMEMLAFFKSKGIALSSENGADFGIPWTDSVPTGKHRHVSGDSIPLWSLVFHDCVVSFRGVTGHMSATSARRCLEDMLWGYAPSFHATHATWPRIKAGFADAFHVDEWHGRIGTDEMTAHRYLSDDCLVEQSEFSSGLSIIANFADEERDIDGRRIAAEGYCILE